MPVLFLPFDSYDSSKMAGPTIIKIRDSDDENTGEMIGVEVNSESNCLQVGMKIALNVAERQNLIDLHSKYKTILDCRRNDLTSAEKRRLTWEQLTDEFNAAALTVRTSKQLKKAWDNQKTRAKKEEQQKQRRSLKRSRVSAHQDELSNGTSVNEEEDEDEKPAASMLTGYSLTSYDDDDIPTGDDTATLVNTHTMYRVRLEPAVPERGSSPASSSLHRENHSLPSGIQPQKSKLNVAQQRLQELETRESQLKLKLVQRQLDLLDEDASRKKERHDATLQLIRAQSDYWKSIRGVPPSLTA